MTESLDIEFFIEEYNEEQKSIIVKFYSPSFKNPREYYSPLNVGLFNFNNEEDIKKQLFKLFLPTVQSIITQEKDIDLNIVKKINDNINTSLSASFLSVFAQDFNTDTTNSTVTSTQITTSTLNFINQ
jgi:hypothetical protein